MRTEKEMMDLILAIAAADKRIRAVLLNGSRADSKIKKDRFCDFDIVYVTDDINSFLSDHTWINIFGERLILQMPDLADAGKPDYIKRTAFTYLMLFKDYNRIDLTLLPADKIAEEYQQDSLTIVLLDKDNLFSNLPPASDTDYYIQQPAEKDFRDCCNEFWWVATYVAKGICRGQVIYAKEMLENPVRQMFLKMIDWYIGTATGFAVTTGKSGKHLQAHLPAELYSKILATYPNADGEHIWTSLFLMTDIFRDLANEVAVKLQYTYNRKEDENVTNYLKWMHSLPKEK
jgi:aminoglycoside 6-adenylyltransferase